MAFDFNLQDFQAGDLLTSEKLNRLIESLRQLQGHLKLYDNSFEGDLRVNGNIYRGGFKTYDRGDKPTPIEIGAVPISGSSAISGSLSPSNLQSDLGTLSNNWRALYAKSVYDNSARVYSPHNIPSAVTVGAIPIGGSGSVSGELTPNENNKYNLGSSIRQWKNIYGNLIYEGGNRVYSPNNKPSLSALNAMSAAGFVREKKEIDFSNGFKIRWGEFDQPGGNDVKFTPSFSVGCIPIVIVSEGAQNSKTYNINATNVSNVKFTVRKGNGGDYCQGSYVALGY